MLGCHRTVLQLSAFPGSCWGIFILQGGKAESTKFTARVSKQTSHKRREFGASAGRGATVEERRGFGKQGQ